MSPLIGDPSADKLPCYLPTRYTPALGGLTGLAQRSLATGADVQTNADTVDNDALLVHVRAKIPTGAALGETHIISESLGFATDVTLPGHGLAPFNIVFVASTRDPDTSGSAGDVR